MPVKPPSDSALQRIVDVAAQHDSKAAAARAMDLPEMTFKHRLATAVRKGFKPSVGEDEHLKARVRRLETELAATQKKALDDATIKRHIIGLKQNVETTPIPPWLLNPGKGDSLPGVPALFVSDLHWGEVVHPSQINGVNRYDVATARRRLEALAARSVKLLGIIDKDMRYPGIVVMLGGDMISGNIHDELTATNELNSMPAVLDLFGALVGFIGAMADTFGKVYLPCVSGNHGRDTRKIWGKDRHHTSFDWLLYCFLAKHFEADKRVTFFIPDGPDAYFRIYNHRYLLTHGDQFRGGDGMIGALGPIIRGDHKKRSRNAQIDMEYDTMLLGHFHQYTHHSRVIVNGSLKGYDEYAYSNNFGFEPPQQALWLTHPAYGITYRMPVFADRRGPPRKTAWVSAAA